MRKSQVSAESDLINLYSGKILQLASDIPRIGQLDNPDIQAKRRSPLCGSTVTVELKVENGIIVDYAQDVKACALGQAAASVVGQNIVGLQKIDVQTARDELHSMLMSEGTLPSDPFSDLRVLEAAKSYPNRHASILLTLDAILDAFKKLETQ